MLKELFETGKSVDQAIDSACEKLGCLREDCQWEIIDLPKKGFLGLKNTPAKVRVSVEVPDEKPAQPVPSKPPATPQRKSTDTHTRESQKQEDSAPLTAEMMEKVELAKEYLAQMIEAFGLNAQYNFTREYGGCCLNIVGDGLGAIIGRRGETLDAIQYLVSLVANRSDGEYLRLTVDCGNYRKKRKETLEALAKKLAEQVLKTNVSKTLEPMNPFERRTIHAIVSEIEGVSSSSIGEEPNRRVVINSPTSKQARGGYRAGPRENSERGGYRTSRPPRDGGDRPRYNNRGDSAKPRDNRRGNDGARPRQVPQVQEGPPKQTPESSKIIGASFGKIDLD